MNPPYPIILIKRLALLFCLLFCSPCFGETESIGSGDLEPTPLMKHEARWLVQALQQAHFNKVPIDKLEPTKFLASFLERLDKQKLYFTQNEVEKFDNSFSPTLITFFKQGNLFPGYEIYNEYKKRAVNRLDWAISYLDTNMTFDTNQSFNTDRENALWSANESELDDHWIKLISFELLNQTLQQLDANFSDKTPLPENLSEITNNSRDEIRKRYERWKKNIQEFESSDVQELYLSTLTQMFDPHTTFMNIKEKERFDQQMNNEFVGIGAVLRDEDGFCTIKELLPGGPAEGSRELEPDDIILKVAQADGDFVDVVNMKLTKIVELIKGPKDTLVRLEIKPIQDPSNSKIVRIIRDKIKLTANLASATLHKTGDDDKTKLIGVIDLPSFYGSSGNGPKATDDVEELIKALKDLTVQGLILDLRKNGGGYLSEAVNLAGLFISRGPVVQVKSTDGKIRKKFDFNPKLAWDGPLIILVSRYSASASEIVAGALKNHKRAIIVGDESTHGKGTVQSLIPMKLPLNFAAISKKRSAAKITIQKYYLPSGDSTQIGGVKSDISIDTINTFLPIGESDLDNALEWDRIPAVNFRRPDEEFLYALDDLAKLKELSETRQNTLSEFTYLKENISWFKKKRETKTLSLNLLNRLSQKKTDLEASKALTKTFESLAEKAYPFSEVKLRIVKEQVLKSQQARGEESASSDDDGISFENPNELDIRLHESVRIMVDWIDILEGGQLSQKSSVPL
ncbi:MAG: tail-specific protease [Opitutae bacterium]|nr:tail-specific protease [Opitutae bacterium]|tara:strand:+ start:19611 stop:21836 length:2226 start_codon:yes stop_codon:yes gene_type:complete